MTVTRLVAFLGAVAWGVSAPVGLDEAQVGAETTRSTLRFSATAAPGFVVDRIRVAAASVHVLIPEAGGPASGETMLRFEMGGVVEAPTRELTDAAPFGSRLDVLEVSVGTNATTQALTLEASASLSGGGQALLLTRVYSVSLVFSIRRIAPELPANWFAHHAVGRASFGMTPDLNEEVSALESAEDAEDWADRFLKTQLELDPNAPWPTVLDDTRPLTGLVPVRETAAFENVLAGRVAGWQVVANTPRPSAYQLTDYALRRMIEGQAQLREMMTYFWDNHFHTAFRAANRGHYEWVENVAFRRDAFGSFRTLLGDSAQSAAMLLYLDQDRSRAGAPNENYARELMELHTLGVGAGYTASDISAAARVLTGWRKNSVVQPGFRFVASRHESGDKFFSALFSSSVIRYQSGSNGVQEGEELLDMLATMDATARFLSRKLIVKFVTETPDEAYVARIAEVFAGSGGNIRKVLIAIFSSPEFRDPSNYLTKVKTPLELVTTTFRSTQAQRRYGRMNSILVAMGMPLFRAAPPTGYSEFGVDWLGTNLILVYSKAAFEIVDPGFSSTYSIAGRSTFWRALEDRNILDEADVVETLGSTILRGAFGSAERQRFLRVLRSGGEDPFIVSSGADEAPLDLLVGALLVSPSFYHQ